MAISHDNISMGENQDREEQVGRMLKQFPPTRPQRVKAGVCLRNAGDEKPQWRHREFDART